MHRISSDKDYYATGKIVIDADGIPFEPAAKTYVDQRAPIDSFAGTGSPEGKVSAPVGSTYTDTAATNGAIRWIKTSGTGDTGWRVEYGDTALRNVTSLITNASGRLSLSRVGSTVFLNGQNIIPSPDLTSGNSFISALPLGFRPMERRDFALAATLGSSTNRSAFQFATGAIGVWLPSTRDKYSFQLSWQTSDVWPTTLPGTPA